MRGMKVFGAVMAALMFAGCGGDAGMAHQREDAGIPGWTDATTPAKVETDLAELFDPSEWVMLCHRLIWHGRRRCHSRRPACGVCPVAEWCPSFGEGPTDPEEAATLVREPRR